MPPSSPFSLFSEQTFSPYWIKVVFSFYDSPHHHPTPTNLVYFHSAVFFFFVLLNMPLTLRFTPQQESWKMLKPIKTALWDSN